MNLTISGGSTQQQDWVQDALDASSYPYDQLQADVTVRWAPSTPCGMKHTYMCTSGNGDGSYTITIEDWADDPTNPNLSGLPNPQADIKTFYEQSVIHEFGHVAEYVLLSTDELRAQAAGLFWRVDQNAGTGRRYGTLDDYAPPETDRNWADLIQEAIPECVKCGFYQGRLIYTNRTNWRIDASKWATLMALIQPLAGTVFEDHFDTAPRPEWGGVGLSTYVSVLAGQLMTTGPTWLATRHFNANSGPNQLITMKVISDITAAGQDPAIHIGYVEPPAA